MAIRTAGNSALRIDARYAGTCGGCKASFAAGTEIYWDPASKATVHADLMACYTATQVAAPVAEDFDDEAYLASMDTLADRIGTARDNRANAAADYAREYDADAAADLAWDERAEEEAFEHRMNCDDLDCLTRSNRALDWSKEVDADDLADEYDRLMADRADQLLNEYDQEVRMTNVHGLSRGTYRVELSGRRNTDAVNLTISPNPKDPAGLRFKIAGDEDGLGRVVGTTGEAILWNYNLRNDERVKKALAALDVLLGAETPGKYGKAYARQTATCYRCGSPLSDEDSLDRMMGPICYRKAAEGIR